jgi:hypothetical protein
VGARAGGRQLRLALAARMRVKPRKWVLKVLRQFDDEAAAAEQQQQQQQGGQQVRERVGGRVRVCGGVAASASGAAPKLAAVACEWRGHARDRAQWLAHCVPCVCLLARTSLPQPPPAARTHARTHAA